MKPTVVLSYLFVAFFAVVLFADPSEGITNKENTTSKISEKPISIKDTLNSKVIAVKRNIAVLTLKNGAGLTPQDAELITDRLNVELFKTNKINLVERNQISDILKEQGFQQSGSCSDEACMVEVGQLLGVEQIISGSIGSLGSIIVINLRMINVGTGKIEKVVSKDINGKIEDVVKYLPNIARSILGISETKIPEPVEKKVTSAKTTKKKLTKLKLRKNTGLIFITTKPDSAEVFVNDKRVGLTPYQDNTLIPGKYKLEIRKDRYESYKESFNLAAGSEKDIEVSLQYKYGVVLVDTKPSNANVKIDGKITGKSPLFIDTLFEGEHTLLVSMENYKTIKDKFSVVKGRVDTLSYALFTKSELDSLQKRKWVENRGKRNARRVLFALIAAGGWGTGIYFNNKVKSNLNKEDQLYAKYMEKPTINNPITSEEYKERYDEYKKQVGRTDSDKMLRNILYGVAGGFTLFFTLSIPF